MAISLQMVGHWRESIDCKAVERAIAELNKIDGLDLPTGTINVKLVDDQQISDLNKQYSGNAYATDVLSFSYIENGLEAVDGELGDIAISLETAKKQAGEAGHDLTDEVALLALHGVLHIIGHDHQTEKDQQIMDQLQSLVLQQAGLTYRDFRWE